MLMLQRAAENVNPSECNDPAVLLACSLGSDSCPAACQKDNSSNEEDTATQGSIDGLPIAGDLSIAVADYSDTIKSAPAKGTVVFNAVDFKASEKVTIESVKVERTGLSSKSDIKGVWFEKDGVAVSAKASLSSDGTATTRFYNNYSVNGTETLDFVVQLSGDAGSEIAFNIIGVTSTAKNASVNTKTTTYRTTNYTVASAEFEAVPSSTDPNADVTYKLGEKETYEIGKFYLSNKAKGEDKDVVIKSLKLKTSGKVDLATTLKNVKVYKDNKVVSKNVELASKDMTISFDDEALANGKRGTYTIMAEVAQLENVWDTIQLYLNKDTELVANEQSTNFRVSTSIVSGKDKMKIYQFNGGKVTFTSESGFAKTIEAAAGSTDVEIARGKLTVAEPVKFGWLNNLTVTATSGATTINADKVVSSLKLEMWGSTYELSYKNGAYTTEDEIYVSRTSDVRILANIDNSAKENSTLAFAANLSATSFKDITFENTDETKTNVQLYVAGAINISKLTVKTPTFSIANKAKNTAKVVRGNADPVVIFDWEVTTNKDNISVTDLVISKSAWDNISGTDWIDLTIYVNGDEYVSTATYNAANSTVKFNNIGNVEKWKSMKLKIEATPNVASTSTISSITFRLDAEWSDSQSNKVKAENIRTLKLEFADNSEVTIANSSATSTVEVATSNTEILKFTADVENSSATLNEIEISWDFNGLDGSVTAELSNGTTLSNGKVSQNKNKITFDGINETVSEGTLTVSLFANIDVDKQTTASAAYDQALAAAQAANPAYNKTTNDVKEANHVCTQTEVTNDTYWCNAIGSGNTVDIKYTQADIDAATWAIAAAMANVPSVDDGMKVKVTSITLKYDTNGIATKDGLSIVKYFAKAQPKLAKQSTSVKDQLLVEITNPSDSSKSITIVWFGVSIPNGLAVSPTLNGQSVTDLANIESSHQVTLTKGSSTQLRLDVSWTSNWIVKITSMTIQVVDGGKTYTYVVDSNYTNVATWWDLQINYKQNS